jgi:exosome complex RNA-binding protein Rrp4
MNSFQDKKSDWRKLLESWPSLVILSLLLVFFAINIILFLGKMIEARKSRDIAENKVAELLDKKDQLHTEINTLNTDKGKESLIREKFGLAREGEGMIVVINPKKNEEVEGNQEKQSNFFSFFNRLFK